MDSIISSSTLMSIMPTLMPALSGIAWIGIASPRRLANAVREFAKVLTRMPNHATPKLPAMPTRLNARMTTTRFHSKPCRTPKYSTMMAPMNSSSTSRNLPCCTRYVLHVS